MSKKSTITAEIIKALLDKQHRNPERSMVVFEVADATGSLSRRWADAVSMEFWPSKGCEITGYEIKVSRSDWLSEMNAPEKSQAVSQFCDRWYLVSPKGVLGIDELPKTWGHIVATEDKLRTAIKAPKRETEGVDRYFMASLMRSIVRKYSDHKLMEEKIRKAREDERKYQKDLNEGRNKSRDERYAMYQMMFDEFQRITGVRLDRWNYENTASAIRYLSQQQHREKITAQLERRIRADKEMLERDEKSLNAIKDWPGEDE